MYIALIPRMTSVSASPAFVSTLITFGARPQAFCRMPISLRVWWESFSIRFLLSLSSLSSMFGLIRRQKTALINRVNAPPWKISASWSSGRFSASMARSSRPRFAYSVIRRLYTDRTSFAYPCLVVLRTYLLMALDRICPIAIPSWHFGTYFV